MYGVEFGRAICRIAPASSVRWAGALITAPLSSVGDTGDFSKFMLAGWNT